MKISFSCKTCLTDRIQIRASYLTEAVVVSINADEPIIYLSTSDAKAFAEAILVAVKKVETSTKDDL